MMQNEMKMETMLNIVGIYYLFGDTESNFRILGNVPPGLLPST